MLVATVFLAGCDTVSELSQDLIELGRGVSDLDSNEEAFWFLGGVAADEPQAARIGQEILDVGGNAFDAATAVYFTLAVTMPSTSSLGGGGVCIFHDAPTNRTRVIDFLSRPPASPNRATRRASAVPGNVRGFFALHSRYGRLPWSQLVAPAEGMARFGTKVSRAFHHDLQKIGNALLAEPGTRSVFGTNSGGLVQEGNVLVQAGLAQTLGEIRKNGAAAIYKGSGAHSFAKAVSVAGGSLEAADLEGYKATWRNSIELMLGDISVHFTPPPAAAGALAAEMWAMIVSNQRFRNAPAEERPHLFLEAAMRGYADRENWLDAQNGNALENFDLASDSHVAKMMQSYEKKTHTPAASLSPQPVQRPEDPSAGTFVVMDKNGSSVACALTMNGLFGNGLIAKDMGVLMSFVPGQGGRGPMSLGPMLAVDHFTNDFFFAAASSGGVAAATSMIGVAVRHLVEIEDLEASVAAKRVHHSGAPDIAYYEQGFDEALIQSLISRGYRVGATPVLGRVNALGCPQGLPYDPKSCQSVSDPRGYGLAVKIDE